MRLIIAAFACAAAAAGLTAADAPPYAGGPFADSRHAGEPQRIPGAVSCALFDRGGEGVAYHDADPVNHGSGGLNPADGTYLNEFRMREGVDISYTKFHDAIDNSPYDRVQPPKDMLYVGWTEPGEWLRYTVRVARAGRYRVGLLYTSNRGGAIALEWNGRPLGRPVPIPTTYDPKDPIAWRQWHHWNRLESDQRVDLPEGTGILTLRVVSGGNMNLAELTFTPEP